MAEIEMSLLQFIDHIAAAHERIEKAEHERLERVARLIEDEAKSSLGTYQEAAGPFAEWAELADSTKDERVRLGFPENEPGLRTGEARDSIEHVVGEHEAVIGSNDEHLEVFELGTVSQPPRSVLGSAAVRKAPEVAEILGESVVMGLVGRGVVGGKLPIL